MAAVPELPRPFSKGQQITATPFEMLRQAVAWLVSKRIVGVRAPLELKEGPGGTTLGIAMPSACRYAVTTSTITARSGTKLGSGTAKCQAVSGTFNYSAPGAAQDVVVTSGASATIASGRLILIGRVEGDGWGILVDYCD